MTCINLKNRFGDRYRVVYEEAYSAEFGKGARRMDPWLMMIPCLYGDIYPHGEQELAAYCSRRLVRGRLAALACCEVTSEGDFEIVVTFNVEHFWQVAEVLRPRRRRHLRPTSRSRLVAMGKEALRRYQQQRVTAKRTARPSGTPVHPSPTARPR